MDEKAQTYEDFRELHNLGLLMNDEDRKAKDKVWKSLSKILKLSPGEPLSVAAPCQSEYEVRHLIQNYRQWSTTVGHCRHDTKQLVLYSIAKLCYWEWIEDSSLVAEILDYVYDCDSSRFSGIFMRLVSNGVSVWKLTESSSKMKEFSVVVYFLHHACRLKLTYDGIRFLDLKLIWPLAVAPVVMVTVCALPNALLLFLRHGVKLETTDCAWNEPNIIWHLLHVLRICNNRHQMESLDKERVKKSMLNVCSCLNLLLRVVRQVSVKNLRLFELPKVDDTKIPQENIDFIRHLSSDSVPKMFERCFLTSRLQHLCRCHIRNTLNRSWNLPHGIDKLHLPTLIKKYLNLEED